MFDQIANELKAAREKNSMTLAQVANKSKIDIKFLEAIDQGDFAFLPELYVRAFIKNYAKSVGLDENIILKKFEAAKKGVPYVEEEPEFHKIIRSAKAGFSRETPKNNSTETPKQITPLTFDAVGSKKPDSDNNAAIKRRNIIIGGSMGGAILILTLFYFLFIDKSEQIIVVEKPIEDVIQQNQRYIEDDLSTTGGEFSAGVSDSLVLSIIASDTSWIKVSIDEQQLSAEFILLPNSQKSLKAKTNYNIILGNSGAIKLLLDNKPLTFTGKNKIAQSILVNRGGVKYPDKSTLQR